MTSVSLGGDFFRDSQANLGNACIFLIMAHQIGRT